MANEIQELSERSWTGLDKMTWLCVCPASLLKIITKEIPCFVYQEPRRIIKWVGKGGKKKQNTWVRHLGDKGIMVSLLNSKSAILTMPPQDPNIHKFFFKKNMVILVHLRHFCLRNPQAQPPLRSHALGCVQYFCHSWKALSRPEIAPRVNAFIPFNTTHSLLFSLSQPSAPPDG